MSNDWIKIKSEKDLPKKDCLCWIVWDTMNGWNTIHRKEVWYAEYESESNRFIIDSVSAFPYERILYYQIIEKPDLPV